MAVSTRDVKLNVTYENTNTKFGFNPSTESTSSHQNDEPQNHYEEVDISLCDHEIPTDKAKPNNYSKWDDRNEVLPATRKENDEKTKHDNIHLPQKISKLEESGVVKWLIFSVGVMIIFCVGLVIGWCVHVLVLIPQKPLPCEGFVCQYNGSCAVSDGKAICVCSQGFAGSTCGVTPCSRQPCLHGGTCSFSVNSPVHTCQCPSGFYGSNCEVSPCISSPCKNNGVCSIRGSAYSCTCQDGYSGFHCEVTPCTSSPCKNNSTCSVDGSTYRCRCQHGYSGSQCQDNVCDLDNDLNCTFTQDTNDDYDWKRHSGSTSSSKTGPPSAYEGTYYFYFETSNPVATGGVARLTTKPVNLSSNGCLKFYYHMYGAGMGRLNVYQDSSQIWTRNGNQGNSWKYALVKLNPSAATEVTFEAIRGANYTSDIAIDKVQILKSNC